MTRVRVRRRRAGAGPREPRPACSAVAPSSGRPRGGDRRAVRSREVEKAASSTARCVAPEAVPSDGEKQLWFWNLLSEKHLPSLHLNWRGIKGRMERKAGPRCVARKFLCLWIRMTFGRVFPAKARCHYEQRLLRRAFEEWKEDWWLFHREWKLCVRADCHYRYHLYYLMFQRWRTFVQQKQERRSQLLRATEHDVQQKRRQAWKSWLIYVVFRRTKRQMQASALAFRRQSLLWLCWSEWRQRLRRAHTAHALHATAVTHSALRLQRQAWSRWWERLLQAQRERRKDVLAMEHHQLQQKRRSFEAWLAFLQACRRRRRQHEMAERFYCVTVLQTHLCYWRWARERRESLQARLAQAEELGQRMVLRRAFTHWKFYVLLCAERTDRMQVAEEQHRHSSLRWGFLALKDHVAHARRQRLHRNLAHRQHEVSVTRRFWRLWQSQLEREEEKTWEPFLRAARDHYRASLLRRLVRLWFQHTHERRHKQLLWARADSRFQQRSLPVAFGAWKALWQRRLQDRALSAKATGFLRETLEKRAFSNWCQQVSRKQEQRLTERMALLHAERRLLRSSWSLWCQRTVACLQEQRQLALACAHHRRGQLGSALCIWRLHAAALSTERTGSKLAVEHHSKQLLCWAWSRWRESLGLRAVEGQQLMRASGHHRRTTLRRALRAWQAHQSAARQVLLQVALRESRHHRHLLRTVLHRWRENSRAQAEVAGRMRQAGVYHERTLCTQVLVRWREAVCVQVFCRQQEQAAISEARTVLDRGLLRMHFWSWRARAWRAARQRAQLARASRHDQQRLLLRALTAWKAHHLLCARRKLLQRLGAQLLARKLSRSCFQRWRQQVVSRRQEHQATAQALWFWSLSLQAKVWAAWLGFVEERRRKKMRLEQAAQAHQRALLWEGAIRLLRFSAAARASRQQAQAWQQAQAAHSLQRVVLRCALLWKQKVLGRNRVPGWRGMTQGPSQGSTTGGASTLLPGQRPGTFRPCSALGLASGDAQPLMPVPHPMRKQPRRPHFLLEPEQSLGPCVHAQRPEKLPEHGLPQPAPATSCPLSQPGVPSCTSDLRPNPLSPLCGLEVPATVQPLECHLHLIPPEDPVLHPVARSSRGEAHVELEAELEAIQEQLQECQATQRDLRSCRRQACSLRRWLELSQEEPRPEDLEVQLVQSELQKVEWQIQRLVAELRAQRRPVEACVSRVRALQRTLR